MRKTLMAVTGFLVLAVGLAACGGSSDDSATTTAAAAAATTAEAAPMDIVDTAVAAGDFTTLATALKAAGLVDTLEGAGPYTVFAPTDEAFAKLPAGTLEDLLKPENKDQLTAILTYHVVDGDVMSSDLSDGLMATTLQGDDLSVSIANGTVKVNDSTVTTADIAASNGVIHVVDTVLLPPTP